MTFEERLEAMTHTLQLQISLQADAAKRQEEAMARHDDAISRHDREMAEIRAGQAKTDAALRRAIRFSVQEARNQRQRRQELAELGDKRHQELQAPLKDFLERRGNGRH